MSEEGTKVRVRTPCGARIACCDCGLVHDIWVYPNADDVILEFKRNDYETDRRRAEHDHYCEIVEGRAR